MTKWKKLKLGEWYSFQKKEQSLEMLMGKQCESTTITHKLTHKKWKKLKLTDELDSWGRRRGWLTEVQTTGWTTTDT